MRLRANVRAAASATMLLLIGSTGAAAAPLSLGSNTLTIAKTCLLTGTPSTSTAVKDAGVQQLSKNSNFGAAATMTVSSSATANQRIYAKFDLTRCAPAIPSSASVWTATLRLFITGLPAGCRTEDLFNAAASWNETTATWNNQPFGTTINNPLTSQRVTSIDVGATSCQNATANQYVGWTATSSVQSWVSGTSTNNGWMIRDDVENSGVQQSATYSTKDANVLTQAPQLVITYTV